MTELKPCPFCGGKAYAKFEPGNKGSFGFTRVECEKCGAVPYVHRAYFALPEDEAIKGVVEAWNRRADNG